MKNRFSLRIAVTIALTTLFLASTLAVADWIPNNPTNPLASTNHKMHYPQLPDESINGLDVNASFWAVPAGSNPFFPYQKILADDWLCSESGPVGDIHIWGSWLADQIFTGAQFKLSIHSDIPKNPNVPGDYSRPGAELWSRVLPGIPLLWKENVSERFWDPNTNTFLGTDTKIWQYNFFIDPAEAFVQEVGTIYWLDVQALVPEPFVFGWKTSASPQFNDDAVFGDTLTFGGPPIPQFLDPAGGANLLPWKDLHYPVDGAIGPSIDLAFVITPEPASGAVVAMGMLLAGLSRRRRGA